MKKISLLIFALFTSLVLVNKVDAASATISVTANKTRVIVGDTVNITVKLSSTSNLGSWSFDVVQSSNLAFVSSSFGGLYITDVVSSSNQTSMTYTFVFKAKASGSASVSIKNSSVVGFDENYMTVTNGSKSLTLLTQSELESSYSKNNYLSSLSVEGYELDPVFNKDTLEYNLEVENGITSVNVKAVKDDSTASISGDGAVSVSEGLNKIEVIVTAQNGSKKNYIINLTVKELEPINVVINGDNYTVIQKKEALPEVSSYYIDTTVTINEKEIPAYHNEITNFTLVGLKDSEGKTNLYIYENNEYKLYKEIRFNQIAIYLLDMDESLIPDGYKQEKITIGEDSIVAYVKKDNEYPIIYGENIETGEKNLYKYDARENTLQRYENVNKNNDSIYLYTFAGMFTFIIISYIFFITIIIKKNKKSKIVLERTMKLNNLENDVQKFVLAEKEDKKKRKKIKKDKKNKKKNNDDEMATF